jgi:surface protein
MAQKIDFSRPFNDLTQYIPQNLQNPVNKGLLDNLFNRFMTRDESVPMYGYVGRKPSAADNKKPRLSQPSVERDINAVVPVLNFDVGTEKIAFTVEDLLNKAKALSLDTDDLAWLYSQANTFAPPINFDKFTNFFNYYWVGKALKADLSWNPELLPEYYVIARPQPSDLDKPNVEAATTTGEDLVLTGSGFIDQEFIITFTTPTTFTVTPTNPLTGPGGTYVPVTTTYTLSAAPPKGQPLPVSDIVDSFVFTVVGADQRSFDLMQFKITREPLYTLNDTHDGYKGFRAGDKFTVDITYLSLNYSVSFTGSSGVRGSVGSVRALQSYQTIDGYQIKKGDRVLVKNQVITADNGIYVVSDQGWTRAADFTTGTWSAGAKVFVNNGMTNASSLWTSIGDTAAFTWNKVPGITQSNTNDWQEGNFWVKTEDLALFGLDSTSDIEQASRPIIEYASNLQLNSFVDVSSGVPCDNTDTATNYTQEKTEFNQLALFDLFRYDGTHAGKVSSIFYYVEDLTATLDVALQKRVKRTSSISADFLFNHGCADEDGSLLFFKQDGALHTVWHAGYTEPRVIDYAFKGAGSGFLDDITTSQNTLQLVWTIKAISPTVFQLSASRALPLPESVLTATVGKPYINSYIGFTIAARTTPFEVGDTFTLRIGNLERPKYVFRAEDNSIQDLYGGPAADTEHKGAYQIPNTFYNNPYNETRAEMSEGSLFTHCRGVLAAKTGNLPLDYAFGGSIYLWGEQHTLLASLLMQKDVTPISMIEMSKRQYDTALNTLRDLYTTHIINYFSSSVVKNSDGSITPAGQVVNSDGSLEQTVKINKLLDALLEYRKDDNDVKTVLFDSTAAVVGFPTTLPQIGLTRLVTPSLAFDLVLGINVLIHHDGHKSSAFVDSQDFRDIILGNYVAVNVKRSDGTYTPAVGSFTSTPPTNPYKGELWMRPGNTALSDLLAFDVNFDTTTTPPTGARGTRWYNRNTGVLSTSTGLAWVAEPSILVAWRVIDLAATLNEMLLITEQRLYYGINPDQRIYDFAPIMSNTAFNEELKRELFNFAALNGLDPLATNYSASNAFTWNYSLALPSNFPALSSTAVPARWYNALTSHQSTIPGIMQTERPDVEPWKLFGFTTYSAWWASLTPTEQSSYTPLAQPGDLYDGTYTYSGIVRAVNNVPGNTTLTGLTTIDGVTLQSGDVVLLAAELAPPNNGLWKVSSGIWSRVSTALTYKMYVGVAEGQKYSNTTWFLTAEVPIINSSPVFFSQVRTWTEAMWAALALQQPSLRTSVNPWTGDLLPPYVNSTLSAAAYALTTVIPAGVAMPYEFGEGSPVEEVWQRSIEYGYALAKALTRFDPLALLGFSWGFNWVKVDNVLYDGFNVSMPGHKRFRLHGETVKTRARPDALKIASITTAAAIDLTLTYDAYDALSNQSFSIRNTSDGKLFGTVVEGPPPPPMIIDGVVQPPPSLVFNLFTITDLQIDDFGIPFNSGDKFTITCDAGGVNIVINFIPTTTVKIFGLGQTFTNALREISVDTKSSYALSAFREWDVNMGYRAGGLVVTDDLIVSNDAYTLSAASYSLLLKKNAIAKDIWLQALRVTVTQYGTLASAPPSALGPQYRSTPITNVPGGDGSDWVFRVEGYNPRYTALSYYNLQNIPNGVAFPSLAVIGTRFFRHDLGELYSFNGMNWDVVMSEDLVTFNVLDQSKTELAWFRPTVENGVISTYLPITIVGIQNLINFLFGYARHTESQGWRFNTNNEYNIDAETGRHRNWQLEIEKLISNIYSGINMGEGQILNPFMDRVWVQQDTGMLSAFSDVALFDIAGDAGVFDVLGVRYKATDLRPLRGNLISSIAAIGPMYSVHAQLDEFEHLFIFKDWIDTSLQTGLLYDAFSGSRSVTYQFNGKQQGSKTFRPEFGGHYIVGNEVRRNVQSSTDMLQNVYDANYVFEDTLTSKHALALLGFNTKDYFNLLDITDNTQFNFWRGLIHAKGTNLSVDAYLNSDRFQIAEIDEYWAYKIAQYGDNRQRNYPEMHIQVEDTQQQFTQLQFDADTTNPLHVLPNFTQINKLDETRWFTLDDIDQDAYFKAEPVGTYVRTFGALETYPQQVTLQFIADKLTTFSVTTPPGGGTATMLNSTTFLVTGACTVQIIGYGPATPRYNPIKLFNYVASELVQEIPHWHPAIGQHNPVALEEINTISELDPARYTYSTSVKGNSSYDPLRPWGDKELGRVWLDTRNLAYVPYYDTTIFPSRGERLSRWGALADFGSVDVYEWVRSTVPPANYAALAAVQAFDADIAPAEKASGDVALQETYYRDRNWFIRPVAWSQTGTLSGGHPSFSGSFNSQLFIDGTTYSLQLGTFAECGISAGMYIGAWNPDPASPKAVSEAIITSDFKKVFSDGSNSGIAVSRSSTLGVPATVTISMSEHTEQTGQLVFSLSGLDVDPGIPRTDIDGVVIGYDFTSELRVQDADTGIQETITLDSVFDVGSTFPTVTLTAGQKFTYVFATLGIQIDLVVTTTGPYPKVITGGGTYAPVQYAIYQALGAFISTRDAVTVEVVVPISGLPNPNALSNDPADALNILNEGIGWTAWEVPTQAQLTADGQQPYSIWKPYPGDYIAFMPSQTTLAEAIAYEKDPLVLNDATIIHRYSTTWKDWQKLFDTVYVATASVAGSVEFTHFENIEPTRTTVYVNGIAQLKASYTIVGKIIAVANVLAGHTVRVTIRKYNPSAEELAFDPAAADNLTYQRQHKKDFEYVVLSTRSPDGSPSTTYYYFWVKNRTVAAAGKKLSVQAIAQELKDGPTSYLTFQTTDAGMLGSGSTSDPYRYDAIAIFGLSYLVTQNDTFKLRFTRNFTLRADEVDVFGAELKNTHTEWGLIRPAQRVRIPETLWTKLVDSTAGEDGAGNPVPSLKRVLYDQRAGTKTQFGFGNEQTMAPSALLRMSIQHIILNTRLIDSSGADPVPDFISCLDFAQKDTWFSTPANCRITLTTIWANAKVSQINEIFFAALEDILAANLELSDIFKTSRLSAYSVRTISASVQAPGVGGSVIPGPAPAPSPTPVRALNFPITLGGATNNFFSTAASNFPIILGGSAGNLFGSAVNNFPISLVGGGISDGGGEFIGTTPNDLPITLVGAARNFFGTTSNDFPITLLSGSTVVPMGGPLVMTIDLEALDRVNLPIGNILFMTLGAPSTPSSTKAYWEALLGVPVVPPDAVIDWGDGTTTNVSSYSTVSHTYTATSGTFTVTVSGTFQYIEAGDHVVSVDSWSNAAGLKRGYFGINITNVPNYLPSSFTSITFVDAASFNDDNVTSWDTSNLTSMAGMFASSNGSARTMLFNQDIGGWDTGKVTDMSAMFQYATSFNQGLLFDPIGNLSPLLWNTSNVTNMSSMFEGAADFNQPIGFWDTGKVTNMSNMFAGAPVFDQGLSGWNTSSVTNMSSMFAGSGEFNRDIGSWDTSKVTNMSGMFSNAKEFGRFNVSSIGSWNTSSVTNMSGMFSYNDVFNTGIGSWDTSSVTNMSNMFAHNTAFNQPIGTWDTSSVTDMSNMFYGNNGFNPAFIPNRGFNQPIGSWDTGAVTTMEAMFSYNDVFNQPIGTWDTSSVTTMENMFRLNNVFNKDLSGWDTSSVTIMRRMFNSATAFNRNIGAWNTSAVTIMVGMFHNATAFNQPIGSWNTGAVLDFSQMFFGASAFNRPIGSWNTSSGSGFDRMFCSGEGVHLEPVGTSSFNQDLSGWDMGRAANMSGMFKGATFFNGNISSWRPAKVYRIDEMFRGATSFNQDISGWNAGTGSTMPTTMEAMFYGASAFRQDIGGWDVGKVNNMSLMFQDAGAFSQNLSSWCVSLITTTDPYYLGTGNGLLTPLLPVWGTCPPRAGTFAATFNTALTGNAPIQISLGVPVQYGASTASINWGDGNTQKVTLNSTIDHQYSIAGTYNVTITGNTTSFEIDPNFDGSLVGVDQWDDLIGLTRVRLGSPNLTYVPATLPITITDTSNMFEKAYQFNQDISGWDVSRVTNMSSMFNSATVFNQPIGSWDTFKVTNMNNMFFRARAFNQNINLWRTGAVTNMSYMFCQADVFNQPLATIPEQGLGSVTTWSVGNVTNMSSMFDGALAFNQNISNWSVNRVTNMSRMFFGALAFNQNISTWNTAAVTNMEFMFANAAVFNQPIGSWNTGIVTNMRSMFSGATLFSQPIAWNTRNVTNMNSMFSNGRFNRSLFSLNTSAVTDMNSMFAGNRNFNQPIGAWKTGAVIDMGGMFNGVTYFNQDLTQWCVTNIASEPTDFATGADLLPANYPVWGTCPSPLTFEALFVSSPIDSISPAATASIFGTGTPVYSNGVTFSPSANTARGLVWAGAKLAVNDATYIGKNVRYTTVANFKTASTSGSSAVRPFFQYYDASTISAYGFGITVVSSVLRLNWYLRINGVITSGIIDTAVLNVDKTYTLSWDSTGTSVDWIVDGITVKTLTATRYAGEPYIFCQRPPSGTPGVNSIKFNYLNMDAT